MAIYRFFPLNMVIFHSYVKLPEGNTQKSHHGFEKYEVMYNCYDIHNDLDDLGYPHDLGNLHMMSCGWEDRILQIRSEWGHHHLLWMFHTRNGEIQKHLKEGQKPEQMN